MFSEHVANSSEKLGKRDHFQVKCFQSTALLKVYFTRNIALKFIRNFGSHTYSEQNSDASGRNLQIFHYYYKF